MSSSSSLSKSLSPLNRPENELKEVNNESVVIPMSQKLTESINTISSISKHMNLEIKCPISLEPMTSENAMVTSALFEVLELNRNISALKTENHDLNSKLDESREEILDLNKNISIMKREYDDLNSRMNEVKARYLKLTEENNELIRENKANKTKIDEIQKKPDPQNSNINVTDSNSLSKPGGVAGERCSFTAAQMTILTFILGNDALNFPFSTLQSMYYSGFISMEERNLLQDASREKFNSQSPGEGEAVIKWLIEKGASLDNFKFSLPSCVNGSVANLFLKNCDKGLFK